MRVKEIQDTLRQIRETKQEIESPEETAKVKGLLDNLSKELVELEFEVVIDSYLYRKIVSLRNDLEHLRES